MSRRYPIQARQIATRAVGGAVDAVPFRDPCDGTTAFGVRYRSRGGEWVSPCRFTDIDRAEAGALVLSQFLGTRRE
jgi:hypothetical protein